MTTPDATRAPRHHHNRHPWCQPGDCPDRHWTLRFEDADQREQFFTDEDEARAAYDLYSPTWNCTLLAAAEWSRPPQPTPPDLSLLGPGVEVDVRLVVCEIRRNECRVAISEDRSGLWIDRDAITAIHAPAQVAEPAPAVPIAVGDGVRTLECECIVLAIDGDEAWVRFSEDERATEYIRDLTHVAPADGGA